MIPKEHGCQGFMTRPYRMKRLKSYTNKYTKDRTKPLYDANVASVLKAQGFCIEETPRSIYTAEKLYEALETYNPRGNHVIHKDGHYASGFRMAYKAFARPKSQPKLDVLPFDANTIQMITSNPSGSPGLTNYGCTKAESMTRALERGIQTLKGEKQPEPCLAFARTQFNEKTRLVWGYPYSMTAIEGLLAYPLNQHFKTHNTPMAYAKTSVDLGTRLRVSSYHKEWCYSLDMSQFDATLCSDIINDAFKILRTWFDLEQIEPVSGVSVREILSVIRHYFINTTIVMPDQHIYIGKNHGVPSGSYFTQMIDSVCNCIIAGTISSKFSLNIQLEDLFILGDDIVFWSNRKVSLDSISRYAGVQLGVKLHGQEKSNIYHYDEDIHFLGRDWMNGLPSLDENGILSRMVFPESYRKYSRDPNVRQREVRMLILSYVAQYRNAWRIATSYFRPELIWFKNGTSDISYVTYADKAMYEGDLDPNFVSGLQRYKMIYQADSMLTDPKAKRLSAYLCEAYKP